MEITKISMATSVIVLLSFSSAKAQTVGSPALSPTLASAPVPDFVNLTDLLFVAGPFHTFLNYLESTKVIQTFLNQTNNTG